jgi:hypothetical protein
MLIKFKSTAALARVSILLTFVPNALTRLSSQTLQKQNEFNFKVSTPLIFNRATIQHNYLKHKNATL